MDRSIQLSRLAGWGALDVRQAASREVDKCMEHMANHGDGAGAPPTPPASEVGSADQ